MVVTRILSTFFFIAAVILAGFLVYRIKFKIEEDARIAKQESMVINKLKMIRDAEVAYLAVNGKYTGSFDTLISFIDTGSMYITQRNEQITQKEYGGEDVTITIDTIGKVQVKDSIFIVREPVLSLSAGTIQEIKVSQGSKVQKDEILATILSNKGKTIKLKAPYSATVEKLYLKEGEQVIGTENFALLSYKRINDIKTLPYIPGIEEKKQFELFAGKVEKSNVKVDVLEIKDTNPVNPERRKNKNPLTVGSRTEVSVAGNWGGEE